MNVESGWPAMTMTMATDAAMDKLAARTIDFERIENYLTISQPESDRLRLEESRRMTGPGMIWDK